MATYSTLECCTVYNRIHGDIFYVSHTNHNIRWSENKNINVDTLEAVFKRNRVDQIAQIFFSHQN